MNDDVVSEYFYKDYKCVSRNPYGFWDIQLVDAGTVPKELRGHFTTVVDAERQIDSYLLAKENEKSHAEKHKEKVLADIAKKEAEIKANLKEEKEEPKKEAPSKVA